MPRRRRCWERRACYHITHRCHNREYRFRFEKYRRLYRQYLFEATKRFNVRVLSWMVTSNHTHLLVTSRDRGTPQISEALQLVHGKIAQHYSLARRCDDSSFWSNRFHSTQIQSGSHLGRCLFYIDLNMVRAGVVEHPSQWRYGTWPELFGERQRYRIVNCATLLKRLEMGNWESFARWYMDTLDDMLSRKDDLRRQPFWSSAIAVGDADWLSSMARRLALKRFEIREANTVEYTNLSGKPFFLGSVNQCKLP